MHTEEIVMIQQADKNVKSYYKYTEGVKMKHKDNEESNTVNLQTSI